MKTRVEIERAVLRRACLVKLNLSRHGAEATPQLFLPGELAEGRFQYSDEEMDKVDAYLGMEANMPVSPSGVRRRRWVITVENGTQMLVDIVDLSVPGYTLKSTFIAIDWQVFVCIAMTERLQVVQVETEPELSTVI